MEEDDGSWEDGFRQLWASSPPDALDVINAWATRLHHLGVPVPLAANDDLAAHAYSVRRRIAGRCDLNQWAAMQSRSLQPHGDRR